jgi:CysZ protein
MIKAFSLSVNQLTDPAILGVLAKSFLLTLGMFAVLGYGLTAVADYGARAGGWGNDGRYIASLFAAIGALVAAWLLFRAIAIPIIGIFADDVVAAVERRHYPVEAARARPATISVSLWLGLMSVVRLILFNLIALPGYAILMFTAVGPFILFLVINAVLLGRDLGEMVAVRHIDRAASKTWLRMNRAQRLGLGCIVTGLFMVPVINILAPILGAAMATHLFHSERRNTIQGV